MKNTKTNDIGRLYSLYEIQDILGVSYRSLLRYIDAGKLKAVKFGRLWKVSETDLKAFMTKGTK